MTMQNRTPILNNGIRAYTRLLIRYKGLVILATILLTAILGWQAATLRTDNRTKIWVPPGQAFVVATKAIQKQFGIRNAVVVSVVADHGTIYQPDILREIARIQRRFDHLPGAARRDILSLAARRVKAIIPARGGMEVKRIMRRVPDTRAEMAALEQRVAQSPTYRGILVSKNARAANVVAAFRLKGKNPSYLRLYDRLRKAVGPSVGPGYKTYIGGEPRLYASVEAHMKTMPLFFGLAFLVIIFVQYLAFRSLQGALLPMLTAVLSTVWALGMTAILGIPMNVLNSVTPILIMAVGTGHSTQMLKRYYEEYARLATGPGEERTWRAMAIEEFMAKSMPVMMLAGSIAVVAFLSLTFASIPMIRDFGILTALGIFSVMVLEISFMPALRALIPAPRSGRFAPNDGLVPRALEKFGGLLVDGKAAAALVLTVLIVGLLGSGIIFLHADNSSKAYFSPMSRVRRHERLINRVFAGTGSLFFQIQTAHRGGIKNPRVLRGMVRFQKWLGRQPGVGRTVSIADFIEQMNQSMHGGNSSFRRIPGQRNLIAQYLLLYGTMGGPNDFKAYVDHGYTSALVWVFAKHQGTAYTERLFALANKAMHRDFPKSVRIRAGGGMLQTVAINRSVVHEKFENMIQMALVVFLLSALILRSFVGGLYVMIPLILIVLANFGIMGWSGLPLDMGTVTTASLAMGIGADYELYLLFRLQEELAKGRDLRDALKTSLRTSGAAVFFVAAAITGGYSVLFFAGFGFYTQLATLVVATMAVSTFISIVSLRALVVLLKPQFLLRSGILRGPDPAETEVL